MRMIQTKHPAHPARAAALLLSALLLLSVTGCGSSQTTPADNTTPAAQTDEPLTPQDTTPQDTGNAATPTETQAGTSADADKTLLAELVEANSFLEVMKRHSSKQLEATYYGKDDEEIHHFTYYVDEGQFVKEDSTRDSYTVTELFYLETMTDENGPMLFEVLFDREDAYREELADAQEYASLSIEPEETLIESMELNGCWYITTEVSDADWVRARIESDAEKSGFEPAYTYADGMRLAYSYVFDMETKDLLEIWVSLREADGTEHSYGLDTITYDMGYDIGKSIFAPYFEATDFRLLHLVFAPGTPEESKMDYSIPKDVYVSIVYQGEEYLGDLYTDPACTQVYESGSQSDELTLYIPAKT